MRQKVNRSHLLVKQLSSYANSCKHRRRYHYAHKLATRTTSLFHEVPSHRDASITALITIEREKEIPVRIFMRFSAHARTRSYRCTFDRGCKVIQLQRYNNGARLFPLFRHSPSPLSRPSPHPKFFGISPGLARSRHHINFYFIYRSQSATHRGSEYGRAPRNSSEIMRRVVASTLRYFTRVRQGAPLLLRLLHQRRCTSRIARERISRRGDGRIGRKTKSGIGSGVISSEVDFRYRKCGKVHLSPPPPAHNKHEYRFHSR